MLRVPLAACRSRAAASLSALIASWAAAVVPAAAAHSIERAAVEQKALIDWVSRPKTCRSADTAHKDGTARLPRIGIDERLRVLRNEWMGEDR